MLFFLLIYLYRISRLLGVAGAWTQWSNIMNVIKHNKITTLLLMKIDIKIIEYQYRRSIQGGNKFFFETWFTCANCCNFLIRLFANFEQLSINLSIWDQLIDCLWHSSRESRIADCLIVGIAAINIGLRLQIIGLCGTLIFWLFLFSSEEIVNDLTLRHHDISWLLHGLYVIAIANHLKWLTS